MRIVSSNHNSDYQWSQWGRRFSGARMGEKGGGWSGTTNIRMLEKAIWNLLLCKFHIHIKGGITTDSNEVQKITRTFH